MTDRRDLVKRRALRLAERAEVFHLEETSYRQTHRLPTPKVSPF